MAYTDRSIAIACSVSVLAITIVTFYYWRSKKRDKANRKDSNQNHQTQLDITLENFIGLGGEPKLIKQKADKDLANGLDIQSQSNHLFSPAEDHQGYPSKSPPSWTKDLIDSFEDIHCEGIVDHHQNKQDSSNSSIDLSLSSSPTRSFSNSAMHLKNTSFNYYQTDSPKRSSYAVVDDLSSKAKVKDNCQNQVQSQSETVEHEQSIEATPIFTSITNSADDYNSSSFPSDNVDEAREKLGENHPTTAMSDSVKNSAVSEAKNHPENVMETNKNHIDMIDDKDSSDACPKVLEHDNEYEDTSINQSLKASNPSAAAASATTSSILLVNEAKVVSVQKIKQTFAQILSNNNNCDSKSVKTIEKIMQTDCLTGINPEADNANENCSTNDVEQTNDNEVDIYQNFPDLTTSPVQDEQPPPPPPPPPQAVQDYYDNHSQGSNDSGQGSCVDTMPSDSVNMNQFIQSLPIWNFPDNQSIRYNFEIPINLCGFLIGRKGRFINPLKTISQTKIVILPYNEYSNICSIFGMKPNVINALSRIRNRFPLDAYSDVTLAHVELTPTIPLSQACQLHLPKDVLAEVIVSCTINAGNFFLQQPTHPSYNKLSHFDQAMKENYSRDDAPLIPQVYPGLVCVVPTVQGFHRARITYVHDSGRECDLILVDYGGHVLNVPVTTLRQIHYNFMSLPFQASECYLARVKPVNAEIGWTPEANECFEKFAHGQIIYAFVENIAENGVPFVNLLKPQLETSNYISIIDELVNKGHAELI